MNLKAIRRLSSSTGEDITQQTTPPPPVSGSIVVPTSSKCALKFIDSKRLRSAVEEAHLLRVKCFVDADKSDCEVSMSIASNYYLLRLADVLEA